jgi:hypothetical protein
MAARLEQVWAEVKGDYIAEIKKYHFERMRQDLAFLWQYLRMPRKDTLVLANVPNLLDSHYQARLLAKYEQSGKCFDAFLPDMLEALPDYRD